MRETVRIILGTVDVISSYLTFQERCHVRFATVPFKNKNLNLRI